MACDILMGSFDGYEVVKSLVGVPSTRSVSLTIAIFIAASSALGPIQILRILKKVDNTYLAVNCSLISCMTGRLEQANLAHSTPIHTRRNKTTAIAVQLLCTIAE